LSLAGACLITEKCMQTCTLGLGRDSGSSSVSNGNNGKIDAILDVK